jgi:hypothetical protein
MSESGRKRGRPTAASRSALSNQAASTSTAVRRISPASNVATQFQVLMSPLHYSQEISLPPTPALAPTPAFGSQLSANTPDDDLVMSQQSVNDDSDDDLFPPSQRSGQPPFPEVLDEDLPNSQRRRGGSRAGPAAGNRTGTYTTFNVTLSQSLKTKLEVFDYFMTEMNVNNEGQQHHVEPVQLMVSQEPHTVGGHHFHVLLKLPIQLSLQQLRASIMNGLHADRPDASLNIKSIASDTHFKSVTKYDSKYDREPMCFNMPMGNLNLLPQLDAFAVRTSSRYDPCDALVVNNPYANSVIQQYHERRSEDLQLAKEYNQRVVEKANWNANFTPIPGTWIDRLHKWIEALPQVPAEVKDCKRSNVYIHGPGGTGKSYQVETLMPDLVYAFMPSTSDQFAFNGLHADHRAIYISDADNRIFEDHREQMLRLLDGRPVSLNQKNKKAIRVLFNKPVVIVSNYDPPPEDGTIAEKAIRRRFEVIKAEETYDTCVTINV